MDALPGSWMTDNKRKEMVSKALTARIKELTELLVDHSSEKSIHEKRMIEIERDRLRRERKELGNP